MPYEPLLPPWSWNPAATFQTAFTAAREEQRAQEEFQAAQEMERILFPIKQQQAQLALEKMNLEMEKTKGELERQRILTRQATEATRNVNRGINGALLEGPAPNTQSTPAATDNYFSRITPQPSNDDEIIVP
jgi:hypothetical protein